MSRTPEDDQSTPYNFNLLNIPPQEFLDAARQIAEEYMSGSGQRILFESRDRMVNHNPGLYKNIGGWIFTLRGTLEHLPPDVVEAVESAFNNGVLMNYELMHRISQRSGIEIIDPPFDSKMLVDSEVTQPVSEDDMQVIHFSRRGEVLPTRFPAIFDANVEILATMTGLEANEMKSFIFSKVEGWDRAAADVANFLAGAAEIVLPLERQAEVIALENAL